MHNVEFMEVVEAFKNLEDVQLDEGLWKNRSFAQSSKGASLDVLQNEVDFVVLDDGVLILNDVFVVEALEDVDLLLDGADVLLADGYLFEGHENAVVEVDAFVDFPVGALPDLLDELVALDGFVFRKTTHVDLLLYLIFECYYSLSLQEKLGNNCSMKETKRLDFL